MPLPAACIVRIQRVLVCVHVTGKRHSCQKTVVKYPFQHIHILGISREPVHLTAEKSGPHRSACLKIRSCREIPVRTELFVLMHGTDTSGNEHPASCHIVPEGGSGRHVFLGGVLVCGSGNPRSQQRSPDSMPFHSTCIEHRDRILSIVSPSRPSPFAKSLVSAIPYPALGFRVPPCLP